MKIKFNTNTKLARALKRLMGERCGAVAMEYIIIALLIGAAVVGLVMVLSGALRNAGTTIDKTMTAGKTSDISSAASEHKEKREAINGEIQGMSDAGNQIGGEF